MIGCVHVFRSSQGGGTSEIAVAVPSENVDHAGSDIYTTLLQELVDIEGHDVFVDILPDGQLNGWHLGNSRMTRDRMSG